MYVLNYFSTKVYGINKVFSNYLFLKFTIFTKLYQFQYYCTN
jgi:hypothetical protein